MSFEYRGILCVLGAFLIHFSLGTIYTFGNMSPYIASYLKFITKSPNVANSDMVWIFASGLALQGFTMTVGGILNKRIGPRLTTLIGCWLMSFAVMLTFFTIKVNLYVTILTYGAIFGVGIGIAYSVAIASAIKWYPNKRGLVIGIVVAGFGLGSLVFNQIQTAFINPNNLKPEIKIGNDKYFGNVDMLNRVPFCFLLIGGLYAFIQLLGCMFLFTPAAVETNEFEKESNSSDNIDSITNEESQSVMTKKEVEQISPLQALRTRDFWVLWCTFMLLGTINVFATSLYKTFGQLFISSDYFLAIVGSVSSIFNAGGRLFWGQIMDRFSYKIAMRCVCVITAILMGTFYCCKLVSGMIGAEVMIMIWVCGLLANIGGIFALMPAATAKLFGTKHVATVFGMLFTANAIASFIGAITTSILLSKIGYLGIFEIGAGITAIGFILTFLHKRKNL